MAKQEVKAEEESEDQEFTYQNPILENPKIETPNFQTQPNLDNQENDTPNIQTPPNQNNLNSEIINQYLSPVIQQQIAYAPIVKLNKFNGEEDDAQDTADAWYQSLTVKPQNFNGFKTEFLQYFSNNNSINKLANTFTTIRQGDTETVTTYLECFHRNLCQIQAIQANYFTAPQILNQFIRRLCSSILQRICPMHSVDLSTTVTYARDFEAAELKANHAQAVNLAMNGSSKLNSKLKQFSDSINQKLEGYLSCPSLSSNQLWQPETCICHNCDSEPLTESRPIPTYLPVYNAPTNLSTTSLSTTATNNLSDAATSNISTTATSNLSNTHHSNTTNKPSLNNIREPKIEDYPKLEIGNGCTLTDPQLFPPTIRILSAKFGHRNQGIEQQPPTNNIPPATITENESLNAIFLFEFEEPSDTPLFSGAALEEKPITAIYTDDKINGHSIKLILDSGSAGSIITQQLMDQLGCRVNRTANTRIITTDEVIKTPIALVGNDWLFKTNAMLDWMTQELVLSQNAMCSHFKATNTTAPLIDFEEEKPKPIWEAYQVLWANEKHNKLLPILSWDDNGKRKQKKTELTWNANQKNYQVENRIRGKKKKEEEPLPTASYTPYTDTPPQLTSYCQPKLICVDCGKKLLSIGTCCGDDEEYQTATKFYCCACLIKCFGRPKQVGKWDNTPCLACGETLFNEEMWNDIPGREGTCNETCQYMILINDWVHKETPINDVWK
ncbi:hypothetical protein G9A89_015147 [Geosiphon pyriformis]|nr:hypothetical protein G9A89_015147 [Geosiphon pyriformis]